MKSHTKIFLFTILDVTIKDSKCVKIYSVNPLYFIFSKANGYFAEINKNKYQTLVPNNQSKEIIKKYEEIWNDIRDLIRPITKNPGNYNEKHKKI